MPAGIINLLTRVSVRRAVPWYEKQRVRRSDHPALIRRTVSAVGSRRRNCRCGGGRCLGACRRRRTAPHRAPEAARRRDDGLTFCTLAALGKALLQLSGCTARAQLRKFRLTSQQCRQRRSAVIGTHANLCDCRRGEGLAHHGPSARKEAGSADDVRAAQIFWIVLAAHLENARQHLQR
eukprot:scaffold7574_cov68-Phaeocystis_antarctica.AAC.9